MNVSYIQIYAAFKCNPHSNVSRTRIKNKMGLLQNWELNYQLFCWNCSIFKFSIVWTDLIIRSSLRSLWQIMRHFRMIFNKEMWNVVNRKAFLFPYFASIDLLYCKQNWPGLPHPLALPSSMVRKGTTWQQKKGGQRQ